MTGSKERLCSEIDNQHPVEHFPPVQTLGTFAYTKRLSRDLACLLVACDDAQT